MYKFKRILRKVILLFLCFLCIFSLLNIQTSAVAVEVIGGSYVTYAILSAALAAAGYTVATNQISPEIFEGILSSPNAELINALIQGTTAYLTSKGMVYFNWTAAQWSVFTQWVNTYVSTGTIQIPANNTISVPSSEFVSSSLSSYVASMIPSSNGIIGYNLGNSLIRTVNQGGYIVIRALAETDVYFQCGNGGVWNSSYPGSAYVFGSPLIMGTVYPELCIGIGANAANNSVAHTAGQVTTVWTFQRGQITQIHIGNTVYNLNINNSGFLTASNYSTNIQFTGTAAFPQTYGSISAWVSDVINSGALVGDWRGIGRDVINPAGNHVDVGIDAYPDYQVGEGTLSIPDVIGGTIDIPLNPYIDGPIDLSHDPVPIDFTDWPDRTIETTPDDVVPDVRLNPPADVTANPDTPWADDESYPLDYPTDTTTDNLPPGNNPNPDPGQNENTNRLKLGPILLSKFPFCLPWDLQHGLKVLIAPAVAPQFTIPFVNERLGINTSINIDLSFADTLARVTRWFLSALWVVILILITSKIIWK